MKSGCGKEAFRANPLIIKLDRSLMAQGSSEAGGHPPSSVIKYPIYGIELRCSFTLQRAAVIGV